MRLKYANCCIRGPWGDREKLRHIARTPRSRRKDPQWLLFMLTEPVPLSQDEREPGLINRGGTGPWHGRGQVAVWASVRMKDRGLILILFSCYFYHRMDDPVIFLNYLTNTCNVTVPRAQNKILGFLPDFRALLNTPESQINEFVKNTHSSNSARAANARILVPSGAINPA